MVSSNRAYARYDSAYGGGIFNIGNLKITASTVSNNSAFANGLSRYFPDPYPSYGGGIYNLGSVAITDSTISDNSAADGGGVSNSGNFSLTNSTVSGNSVYFRGGGIYNSGTLTLINNTITNNNADGSYGGAPDNGGVFNESDSTVMVGNTIIAGNLAGGETSIFNPDVFGNFIDVGNNLIGNDTGSTGFTTSSIIGNNANLIDPKLGPLQNNGGATSTHALLLDSFAINTGNNALIPAGVNTDQRGAGFDRIIGTNVDIGAYESSSLFLPNLPPANTIPGIQNAVEGTPFVFSTTKGNQIAISDPDAGSNPLQVTLTATNGVVSLNSSTGLTFTTGDGTADPILTFTGTISNINNALNGLSFIATDYNNLTNLIITTDDQGNTGTGGALSNTDTIDINIGANQIGTNDADTFVGGNNGDRFNGQGGNDTITGGKGNDTLTGGAGNDMFIYTQGDYISGDGIDTITDFSGVGKGSNLSAAVIAQVDTLIFQGNYSDFTAQNLLLTQNGSNLEVSFEISSEGVRNSPKIILENFALENLENLSKSTGANVNVSNIMFYQGDVSDSFDVFNANSTQSTPFGKNRVTFLNDLNNNVNGLDKSNDVINGQGGNDYINGKSGNDLLRGGAGNDTLLGAAGNDILIGGADDDILTGGSGYDGFVYQALSDKGTTGDIITDFSQSQDQLVLTNLFKSLGYSASNPISDGYLRFVQSGSSTQVQLDSNGGADDFTTLVTLNNFTATNLVVDFVVGRNVIV